MKKIPIDSIKPILKNRTVIAVLGIVLALIICFVIAPAAMRAQEARIEVITLQNDISAGEQITADDITTTEVVATGLPDGLLTDAASVVGKYAVSSLYAGDLLTPRKLLDYKLDTGLKSLESGELAISVTVKSLAAGLSGRLQGGDIVSILVTQPGAESYTIPTELTYVEVISVTASTGRELNPEEEDYTGDGYTASTEHLPATVTLKANAEQARILAQAEKDGGLHTALVYRGERAVADEYLAQQAKLLRGGDENE